MKMKDFFDFLERTLDRTALWLWCSVISFVAVVVNSFLASPVILVGSYGVVFFLLSLALFLQSHTIHTGIREWINKTKSSYLEKREQKQNLTYLLATPCKEHVLFVAFCTIVNSHADSKHGIEPELIRSILYRDNDEPSHAYNHLVKEGLATFHTTSGAPLIHKWVYQAFFRALSSEQENEAKKTQRNLKRYGVRLFQYSDWSGLFTLTGHHENMKKLKAKGKTRHP
ncbi:MAG: hypothetical protein GY829_15825 [Gammaproteobacteria bacterium]|nr:hypothetical protein [Gammaproteobacteria bacterium]